jgi:hypothetical protein
MDAETGQRVVGVLGHGRGGEHVLALTSWSRWGNNHVDTSRRELCDPTRHGGLGA